MRNINLGRVILGGLLAGVVMNIGEFILNMEVLRDLWNEAMHSLNRPSMDSISPAMFIILTFFLGIMAVWVYAAIRSRFGAGPWTAICAGLLVWALASLFPAASMLPMKLFSRRLLFYTTVWQFFEIPIATLVGAWIYREEA